jgi:hypothetical protein
MGAQGNAGRGAGTQDDQTLVAAAAGEPTEVMPMQAAGGGAPIAAAFGPDDPEMVELRAFATEVVHAAGGVARRSAYRPRLEPSRRSSTAAGLGPLFAWGSGIASSIGAHPLRTLAIALAGIGAVAGGLLLLVPRDASLQLSVALPAPTGMPAAWALPPPPPMSPIPEEPSRAPDSVPIAASEPSAAPVADARLARPLSKRERALDKKRARRVARASTGRRSLAPSTLARADRGKEGKEPSSSRLPKDSSGGLDRASMLAGMQSIQPLVRDCYRHYNQKGVANVRVDVGRTGKVKSVSVAGPLAKTRTASCVKAALKTARFHGGDGSFQYPLVLK